MTDSLFVKQNSLLKFAFVFLAIILVFLSRISILIFLIIFNLFLFLPDFVVIKKYFKTLSRLSFFWIAYLISGLIMDINFLVQINFLIRFLLMLQLSVYIQSSFTINSVLQDFKFFRNNFLFQSIILFLMYFNTIFASLSTQFKSFKYKDLSLKEKFSLSVIDRIMLLLKEVFDNSLELKKAMPVIDFENIQNVETGFFTYPNLYLFYIITIYVLLLSV